MENLENPPQSGLQESRNSQQADDGTPGSHVEPIGGQEQCDDTTKDVEGTTAGAKEGLGDIVAVIENFSPAERKILLAAVELLKSKPKKERARICKNAETEILKLPDNEKATMEQRVRITAATREWLKQHTRRRIGEKLYTRQWSGPDVMYQLDPTPVRKLQDRLHKKFGSVERSKPFSYFQRARKIQWTKGLKAEDREKYCQIANEWNLNGPTPEIKAR